MNTFTQRRTRALGAGAVGLAAVLALTACGGGAAPTGGGESSGGPQAGGTLRVGIGPGATCVDPQQTFNFNAAVMARAVVDSLTDQDPDTGEIVPWLAESWEINDDATEYVFHLRDGVTFSDGTPLDAETVVANLDYIVSLGAKSSRGAAYMANYESSEAVDDLTVRVVFGAPTAQFLVGTSTLVFGMLSLETTEKTPEERCQGDIVGTGPFTLEEYVQDQRALAVKREGYDWASELAAHSGDAHLDEIEYTWQPVSNVRSGALTSGQVDVAMALETQDVPTVEAAGASVMAGTMPGMPGSFVPNLVREVSGDTAVRLAMNVALDRETIVHTVLGEYYNPAYSLITSNLREHSDFSDQLAYDPAAAEEILDEAGWVPGADGVREKDGAPLAFSITYTEDYGAFYTSLLQLVQQQLNEIGFDVTLENTTQAGLLELQQSQDFDFFITTITESDPDMVRSIIETRLDPGAIEAAGLPPLLAQQQAVAEPEMRSAVWKEIQDIVVAEGLLVPLFEGTQLTGVNANVSGVRYDFKSMVNLYDATIAP